MGLLDFFRRGWTLDGVARPWSGDAVAIHRHLVAHTAAGELSAAGQRLPNENDGVRWVAGARDGVTTHHLEVGPDSTRAQAMVTALEALLTTATAEHFAALYELIVDGAVLGVADDVQERLTRAPSIRAERVHALGLVLAREAPDVEAVKLGIALIGRVAANDRELLLQLGLHDELTLFASVALLNQLDDAEPVLFDLARRVHGWGRIHLVERLAETSSPEIRAWMLRDGFRNTVMDEYLAHLCATSGELHVALKTPDAPLQRGAAGLFRALAAGGPARDWADYEHAAEALGAWLPQLEGRPLTTEERAALDALAERVEVPGELAARIRALRAS